MPGPEVNGSLHTAMFTTSSPDGSKRATGEIFAVLIKDSVRSSIELPEPRTGYFYLSQKIAERVIQATTIQELTTALNQDIQRDLVAEQQGKPEKWKVTKSQVLYILNLWQEQADRLPFLSYWRTEADWVPNIPQLGQELITDVGETVVAVDVLGLAIDLLRLSVREKRKALMPNRQVA